MTPVLTQDGGYLPEVTIFKKDCRARLSTYSPAVFTKDRRRARPSLPTLPGTDGTVGNTVQNCSLETQVLSREVVESSLAGRFPPRSHSSLSTGTRAPGTKSPNDKGETACMGIIA